MGEVWSDIYYYRPQRKAGAAAPQAWPTATRQRRPIPKAVPVIADGQTTKQTVTIPTDDAKEHRTPLAQKQPAAAKPGLSAMGLRKPRQAKLTRHAVTRLAVATSLVLGVSQLHLPLTDTLCLSYGAAALALGLDSRISFIGALVSIIDVPLLQELHYQQLADSIAIVAFYLLAIGVVAATIEIAKAERQDNDTRPSGVYRLHR